jgi:hypothetical protein
MIIGKLGNTDFNNASVTTKSLRSIRCVAIATRRRCRVAIASPLQLADAFITIAVNSRSPPHRSAHA